MSAHLLRLLPAQLLRSAGHSKRMLPSAAQAARSLSDLPNQVSGLLLKLVRPASH